jgi:hypothetical protein
MRPTPPTRSLPQRGEKYILQACQKLKRKTTKKRNAKWRHCPSLSRSLAESASLLFMLPVLSFLLPFHVILHILINPAHTSFKACICLALKRNFDFRLAASSIRSLRCGFAWKTALENNVCCPGMERTWCCHGKKLCKLEKNHFLMLPFFLIKEISWLLCGTQVT